MSEKPPSDLQDHLGYWLRKLSNHVSENFAARLGRYEVSVPQWVVLRVLFNHDSLPLKDIVTQIGVDQGSLSRMVERLNARGLVQRREAAGDRRAVAISLTPAGREIVPHLAREADENDLALFGQLPSAQREQLLATIRTLLSINGGDATGAPLH